jgi:hypothetical protein
MYYILILVALIVSEETFQSNNVSDILPEDDIPALPKVDRLSDHIIERYVKVRYGGVVFHLYIGLKCPQGQADTEDGLEQCLAMPNSAKDQVAMWLYGVHYRAYQLFQFHSLQITVTNYEGWYNMNLWSVMFDSLFLNSSMYNLERTEILSHSSTMLLNDGRTDVETRQKCGYKHDGVVYIRTRHMWDIAIFETAGSYEGEHTTKWITDTGKVLSALPVMLRRLHDAVGDDDARRVQTVGILNAGLNLRVVRCWAKTKDGPVIFRWSKLMTFPTYVESMVDLWRMCMLIYSVKIILDEVVDVVANNAVKTFEEKEAMVRNASLE